jgi:hypothetical protein
MLRPMTYKPAGPDEVRPNTLQGQSAPNTFRSQTGSGPFGRQELNSGGGNAGPLISRARPQIRLLVYLVLGVLAILVALYLLSATP